VSAKAFIASFRISDYFSEGYVDALTFGWATFFLGMFWRGLALVPNPPHGHVAYFPSGFPAPHYQRMTIPPITKLRHVFPELLSVVSLDEIFEEIPGCVGLLK